MHGNSLESMTVPRVRVNRRWSLGPGVVGPLVEKIFPSPLFLCFGARNIRHEPSLGNSMDWQEGVKASSCLKSNLYSLRQLAGTVYVQHCCAANTEER
jgi:hypothetical protein